MSHFWEVLCVILVAALVECGSHIVTLSFVFFFNFVFICAYIFNQAV